MIIGTLVAVKKIVLLLKEKFCIKETGELNTEGAQVEFLGRCLIRFGDAIKFRSKDNYLDEEFKEFGLESCRVASTPGSMGIKRPIDGCNLLDEREHRIYRRVVGRLQWIVPARPDLCYPVKELERALSSPTVEDKFKVKHVLKVSNRYLGFVSYSSCIGACSEQHDSHWPELRLRL